MGGDGWVEKDGGRNVVRDEASTIVSLPLSDACPDTDGVESKLYSI